MAVKQPWEMGVDDFLREHGYRGTTRTATGMRYKGGFSNQKMSNMKKWHRNIIEAAIRDNKPIPANVLKDYPDLNIGENECPSA